MLLSIDVLPRVLKDEIRDITTRKAIIEADRFLRHPDVRRAIQGVLSPEHYDQFNGWLLSLANDAAVKPVGAAGVGPHRARLRTRTTMVGLGFRVSHDGHARHHGRHGVGGRGGPKAMAKGIFNKKTWAGAGEGARPRVAGQGHGELLARDNWEEERQLHHGALGEMRHRMNEIERDVREQLRDIH
jgi:hypothetical protein